MNHYYTARTATDSQTDVTFMQIIIYSTTLDRPALIQTSAAKYFFPTVNKVINLPEPSKFTTKANRKKLIMKVKMFKTKQ